jgi:hypothetical protein
MPATLGRLLERADSAMYEAKRGKLPYIVSSATDSATPLPTIPRAMPPASPTAIDAAASAAARRRAMRDVGADVAYNDIQTFTKSS